MQCSELSLLVEDVIKLAGVAARRGQQGEGGPLIDSSEEGADGLGDHVGAGLFVGQQLGADKAAIGGLELPAKVLDQGIIGHLTVMVVRRRRAVVQTGQHKHSAGSAADEVHASHTATKRRREPQRHFLVQSIEIGTRGEDRLAAVETLFEEFYGTLSALFDLGFSHSYTVLGRRNSAKMIAVAIATFRLSEVGSPGG